MRSFYVFHRTDLDFTNDIVSLGNTSRLAIKRHGAIKRGHLNGHPAMKFSLVK